jgi:GAF domain-containing protein
MPYVACPDCGLRTYCVREDRCPRCDAVLLAEDHAVAQGPSLEEAVKPVLALARHELSMDAVMLTEISGDRETVRWVDAGPGFSQVRPGASRRLSDTICRRLLDGEIDGAVADVDAEPALDAIPRLAEDRIGAYLGVPISDERARLYVLCCLAHDARPGLGPRELSVLRGMAETIRASLSRERPAA